MSLPTPNLDDKTFAQLVEEARALIPRYAPDWTDHNLSDPGITFIDLFSWLAEMQMYSLNRVTESHYLKFLKFIGTRPEPAKSSQVDIKFSLSGTTSTPITVPARTRVATIEATLGREISFETEEEIVVTSLSLKNVLTQDGIQWIDNTAANNYAGVFYFPFGASAKQNNTLFLGFKADATFSGKEIKLMFYYFDRDLPAVVRLPATEKYRIIPSAQLTWEYWNGIEWRPLEILNDATRALSNAGRLHFKWPEDIEIVTIQELFPDLPSISSESLSWIRAIIQKSGYEIPPRIDSIEVNTISAIQERTIEDEYYPGTGLPFQKIELEHSPVRENSLELKIRNGENEWRSWIEVADFDSSQPDDPHFMMDLEKGILKFGDGIHGQIPASTHSSAPNIWIVRYRTGGGEIGNIAAEKINIIPDASFVGLRVTNPEPANGGSEPETLELAISRVRTDLKKQIRAINVEDLEKLVFLTPGVRVARAKVLPLYHPQYPVIQMPGAITIVVVPYTLPDSIYSFPDPSDAFLENVRHYLQTACLITTKLFVIRPHFIKIKVTVVLNKNLNFRSKNIKDDVEVALRNFLDPLKGGPDATGWPFGREVLKSEIYHILEQIPGISCIVSVSVSAEGCFQAVNGNIKIPKIGLVYSGKFNITVN